jgi:hypothetical protein
VIGNKGTRRALAASLTLSLLLTAVVCVSAAPSKGSKDKAPDWMLDLNSSYPREKYLAAVGQGDTRRDAESDAAGALSRIFNVNVKSDSVATQRYQQIVKDDKSSVESGMQTTQTVGMQSDAQLVNMRFSDPYADSAGLSHIVAYLEREPTAAIYRAAIGKDSGRVDGFVQRAAAASAGLQAFALYDAAYQVGLNAERMIEQLRIIHAPSAKLLEDSIDLQKIAASRDAVAAKLTYKLSVEGDGDGKIAGFVREALSAQSLSFKDDGSLAVKGSWATEQVASNNPKYKSVRWTINMALYDEAGSAIANAVKESRETALTDSDAQALAYREARKFLSKALADSLQDYLTRAVLR